MSRFVLFFGLITVLLSMSSAQGTGGPTFDVASVRRGTLLGAADAARACSGGPERADPETFRCACKPMGFFIGMAYNVILTGFDGPSWITDGRTCFEIVARVPLGATRDQFRIMLQNLLAERFHLSVHHEARTLPSSSLVVGKGGPKLRPSASNSAPAGPSKDGARLAMNPENGLPWNVSVVDGRYYHLAARRMDLKALAAFVESVLHTPVADGTGLVGNYEFTLDFFPDDDPATAARDVRDPADDLPSALQSQLGLKLNTQKVSRDVIVIDHVDQVPTEN